MLKITICFLFSWAMTAAVAAQRHAFKNYTPHEGLVQTEVTDITQDRRGAIWIATHGGLSVFDGKTFANYDDHDVLQSLFINQLLCDSSGVVWIATGNGLLKYDNGFSVFFKAPSIRSGGVNSLTANSKNQLLFVSDYDVYCACGPSAHKHPIDPTVDGKVVFLAFDRLDNLWIVTNDLKVYRKGANGLVIIHTPFTSLSKGQGFGMIKLLGKQGPSPCFVTNYGSFWAVDDSLFSFSDLYPSFRRSAVGAATCVLQDGDSTLWAGGTAGLSKLTPNATTRFAESNGFCDNSVSCLFTDREKNLWIGCTYNGLYKLANEALLYLNPSAWPADFRHVSAMTEQPDHSVLLGTWGKGLFLWKADSVSTTALLPPSVRYITCLLTTEEKTFAGWSGKGLWQMDNRTHETRLVPGFAKNEAVRQMYKTGDEIVIQTMGDVGYVADGDFHVRARRELPKDYVLLVVNNRLYGTDNAGGADVLDNRLQVIRKNIFPQINSRITAIAYHLGHTLVGTFGQGLFVYDEEGRLLKRLDKKSGLNTNIVTALLVDDSRLFIGSNLGLLRAGLPEIQTVKPFTEGEGMFNWECRPNGLKKLTDGGLLMATTNGVYLYYPDKDLQPASGEVTVVDFQYGKNHVSFPVSATDMALPQPVAYKDNAVTITLKGISQRAPDNVLYHYRLQGDEPLWIATADPVITFDDLAPGPYTLKAYITVGSFISKPLSIKFSVDKPLSGKLWFQALLVLLLSGVSWLLLTAGNRIYQRYVQSKTLHKLEKDIAAKQRLTTGSLLQIKEYHLHLTPFLKQGNDVDAASVAEMFLSETSKRIEWLWEKEALSLSDVHRYLDELATGFGDEVKIYHKQSGMETVLQMQSVFPLLQLFSLYLIASLSQNKAAVFSFDSETRTAGRLLLRFYTLTPAEASYRQSLYTLLKEAADRQRVAGTTVDVIQNLAFGNMLVAEVNF